MKICSKTESVSMAVTQSGAAWLMACILLYFGQAAAQSGPATFVTVNGESQSVLMAELLLLEQLARGAVNSPEL